MLAEVRWLDLIFSKFVFELYIEVKLKLKFKIQKFSK